MNEKDYGLKPGGEDDAQETVHLPTEEVKRQTDKVMSIFSTAESREETRGVLDNIGESFPTWDRQTRATFISELAKVEYDTASHSFDEMYERTSRQGVIAVEVTPGFLACLSSEQREETLWDSIRTLSERVDFSNSEDESSPSTLRDFIFKNIKVLPEAEGRRFEIELIGSYALDDNIPSDARYQAVCSYLEFFWPVDKLFTKSRKLELERKSKKQQDDLREHRIGIQGMIVDVACSNSGKENYRGAILESLDPELITDDQFKRVIDLIADKNNSAVLSGKVLRWLLPQLKEERAHEIYLSLLRLIEERPDLPVIQVNAMCEIMSHDVGTEETAQDKNRYFDKHVFIKVAREIRGNDPNAFLRVPGFFRLLMKFDGVDEYIDEVFRLGTSQERLAAITAALRVKPEIVGSELISRVLDDLADIIELDPDEDYIWNIKDIIESGKLSQNNLFKLQTIRTLLADFDRRKKYQRHGYSIELIDDATEELKK